MIEQDREVLAPFCFQVGNFVDSLLREPDWTWVAARKNQLQQKVLSVTQELEKNQQKFKNNVDDLASAEIQVRVFLDGIVDTIFYENDSWGRFAVVKACVKTALLCYRNTFGKAQAKRCEPMRYNGNNRLLRAHRSQKSAKPEVKWLSKSRNLTS